MPKQFRESLTSNFHQGMFIAPKNVSLWYIFMSSKIDIY